MMNSNMQGHVLGSRYSDMNSKEVIEFTGILYRRDLLVEQK